MSYQEWVATRREILGRKSENEAVNRQVVIDAYARIDGTVRRAMKRAGVTPHHFSEQQVEHTEQCLRLKLRDDSPKPDAPLSELINPTDRPPNPLLGGEVIVPHQPKLPPDEKPQTSGRKWEFDDE